MIIQTLSILVKRKCLDFSKLKLILFSIIIAFICVGFYLLGVFGNKAFRNLNVLGVRNTYMYGFILTNLIFFISMIKEKKRFFTNMHPIYKLSKFIIEFIYFIFKLRVIIIYFYFLLYCIIYFNIHFYFIFLIITSALLIWFTIQNLFFHDYSFVKVTIFYLMSLVVFLGILYINNFNLITKTIFIFIFDFILITFNLSIKKNYINNNFIIKNNHLFFIINKVIFKNNYLKFGLLIAFFLRFSLLFLFNNYHLIVPFNYYFYFVLVNLYYFSSVYNNIIGYSPILYTNILKSYNFSIYFKSYFFSFAIVLLLDIIILTSLLFILHNLHISYFIYYFICNLFYVFLGFYCSIKYPKIVNINTFFSASGLTYFPILISQFIFTILLLVLFLNSYNYFIMVFMIVIIYMYYWLLKKDGIEKIYKSIKK